MSYSTRNEAIEDVIITAIEASGVVSDARIEYDIDAIADSVLGDYADGYTQHVDDAEFWSVVAANARV